MFDSDMLSMPLKELVALRQKEKEKYNCHIEKNLIEHYDSLKSGLDNNKAFYSFNKHENFEFDFGPEKKLSIKTIKLENNNPENLQINDFVFNKIDAKSLDLNGVNSWYFSDTIEDLEKKRKKFNKDLSKGKMSNEQVKILNSQIDGLIDILKFMKINRYWIELYKMCPDKQLRGQGIISFQNIDKELRNIIFPQTNFQKIKHK